MNSKKPYTVTEAARLIGVHRQTVYYWMKKGRIKPHRDYRQWPVFTKADVERIKKWYRRIK